MITFPTSRDGLILGELTSEEIEQALEKGSLRQNDYVWSHQLEKWVPVYEAFEITEALLQTIEKNTRPLLEAGLAQLPELPASNANHTLNPGSIGLGNRQASTQPMAKTMMVGIPEEIIHRGGASEVPQALAKTMMVSIPEETIHHGSANAVPQNLAKTMMVSIPEETIHPGGASEGYQALAKTMMVSLPEAEAAPVPATPAAKTMMIDLPEAELNTAAKPMSKTAVVQLPSLENPSALPTKQLSKAITKEMAKTMLVEIPAEQQPQQAVADAKAAITKVESNTERYKTQGGKSTSLIPKPNTRPISVSVPTNTGPLKPVAPTTGLTELKQANVSVPISKPISSRVPATQKVEEASNRFAGGWIIAGILSVAALMGLLSWLSSLLIIAETPLMKENDINSLSPTVVNSKRLMTALHAYAAAHSGLLPLKITDLVGQSDLPTRLELEFTPKNIRGKPGYDYPGAGARMDAPPETIIIRTRWQTVGKRIVVGRLDGTIEIIQQE